jgi:hypothetical protein
MGRVSSNNIKKIVFFTIPILCRALYVLVRYVAVPFHLVNFNKFKKYLFFLSVPNDSDVGSSELSRVKRCIVHLRLFYIQS